MGCGKPSPSSPSDSPENKEKEYSPFHKKTQEKFDSYFTKLNSIQKFNGTILLEHKDSLYTRTFGFADLKQKTPLHLDHAFQLASVSKPLTAAAILKLVEEGKLDLNEKVKDILPGFPLTTLMWICF